MKKFLVAVFPILLIAALNLWAMANRGRFPDPLATHWGISGQPDGFGTLETHLFWVNLALGMVATFWVIVSIMQVPQALKRMFQLILGYLFVMLGLIFTQTLLIQLDLPSAQDAVLGMWVLAMIVPLLALVPLMLAKPEISIDQDLVVRLRGLVLLRVPLKDIASARASEVRAGDFGGWGIRYAQKTTAFIPSSGPALEVELSEGAKVLVRTDSPAQLAERILNQRNS